MATLMGQDTAPPFPFAVNSLLFGFLWAHFREGALMQVLTGIWIVLISILFLRRHLWAWRDFLVVFQVVAMAGTVVLGLCVRHLMLAFCTLGVGSGPPPGVLPLSQPC